MSYKVVYFSRTGTSKRVASKIGNKLSCEVVEITDGMNWKGILGFIKGGFYATANKEVNIEVHGNIDSLDEIILVTPLWAGGLTPAVRAFLKKVSLDKIHLVVTSNGSNIKNPATFKSLSEIVRAKNNEDKVIEDLVMKLK
jgi:protein involved in ribonucleotide reduction